MHEKDISYECIGVAIEIHISIGPGLLESAYSGIKYLKLSGLKLGLLINFNAKTLKSNIHRIVNKL